MNRVGAMEPRSTQNRPVPSADVDAYVAALPVAQQEVANRLRRLIADAAPSARESIKWAQPVYEEKGPFAYFKAHRGHVTLGFWRGVELDGGRGVLESSGSRMAHVKLIAVGEIDEPLVRGLVKKAVVLNREKGDPTRKL